MEIRKERREIQTEKKGERKYFKNSICDLEMGRAKKKKTSNCKGNE